MISRTAISATVFAGLPITDGPPVCGILRVEGEMPEIPAGPDFQSRYTEQVRNQAEKLHDFLRSTLPQGTYFALLALMLRHSAPLFKIGFEKEKP